MWHHHRTPLFQQVSSSNDDDDDANPSTVSAVIMKWKLLGTTMAQPQSGRLHKLTERDRRVLKHVARKNRLSSVAPLTTEFQTASGSHVSTITVRQGSFMKWVSMAVRRTNLGLTDARRTLPAPMHSATCKVWWKINNDLMVFFMVWDRLQNFK